MWGDNMGRRLGVLIAVVVLSSFVVAGTAQAAKVPPVTGTLGACMSGKATFSHPITDTPSTKPVVLKGTAVLADLECGAITDLTGGKLPVTTGSVQFKVTIPKGMTCLGLAAPHVEIDKPSFKITLENDQSSKLIVVARAKPANLSGNVSFLPLSWHFAGTFPQNKAATKTFGNESFGADIALSGTPACGAGVTSVTISDGVFAS
jgi:hypothetical protein